MDRATRVATLRLDWINWHARKQAAVLAVRRCSCLLYCKVRPSNSYSTASN